MENVIRLPNNRDWFWQIGSDDTRMWSSKAGGYVDAGSLEYQAFIARGEKPSISESEAELFSYLSSQNIPPHHSVSTYRIVRRLEDAGLIDEAEAALEANRSLYRRFYTVGAIYAQDSDARAFLTAIGADPDAILAPE